MRNDEKPNNEPPLGCDSDVPVRRDDAEGLYRELAESRHRYREMVMRSPMGMHFYDLIDDRLIFSDYNPAADRLLGVANAQFVGKTIEEAFPPLVRTEVPSRYRAAAESGIPWYTEQISYADNQIVGAFEVHAFQISKGKMVAVFAEITDRKRAEAALRTEKERVSVTLRSIGDGVIAADVEGRVTLMNKAAESMTGWTLEEAVGRPMKDVFLIINEITRQPSENPVEKVLRTLKTVEIANHTVLISRDKTERQIADCGAPIFDNENHIEGVVLVFRDVTEKSRMAAAEQRAERLESLGILAGGIAHDFNNLLGGIFGYIDLAMDMSREPSVRDHLSKAFSTMERARALTQQLLTFSKGGMPILKTAKLGPIIERAARFVLSGTNLKLVCRFPMDLRECLVDENQIAQVIDNIVINAKQAMPTGGEVTISAENRRAGIGEHPSLTEGDYVKITIADTGSGIPREILPRVFDPFFTTKTMGSGLGLATCYSIIQKHGGALDVESEPGAGAQFHIFLPAATIDEYSNQTEGTLLSSQMSGRVLVMDDEDYIREVLSSVLRGMGLTPVAVNSGEDAVEALLKEDKDDPYIAAVLDLTVPGKMGGKEAGLLMHQIRKDLPIFVSSGYSENPVIADPGKYGFTGRLIKPYRKRDVEENLRKIFQHPRD
jgi:PAS domain S-box-containing protein